jgi:Predicted acetyltransferase
MKNIIIRELKPDDRQKVLNLLRTRDELDDEGAEKRTQLMEWCAFKNPFAENELTYFIAEDKEEIIAHLGRMPTEFIINRKRKRGYFIHDLYVHPKYRKKGMGFFLSMSLYKAIEESTESFCCAVWMTELTLKTLRRRGYYELWARRYIKLFNPEEKLRKYLRQETLVKILNPFLRRILGLVDLILLRLIPSYRKIEKIDRFDIAIYSSISSRKPY